MKRPAFTDFRSLTLFDPGVFANFQKKITEKFKSLISPQLPEKRTIARLKGLVLGFHFDLMRPCRRAPLPSESYGLFPVPPLRDSFAFAGACSNIRILLGFVA